MLLVIIIIVIIAIVGVIVTGFAVKKKPLKEMSSSKKESNVEMIYTNKKISDSEVRRQFRKAILGYRTSIRETVNYLDETAQQMVDFVDGFLEREEKFKDKDE